MKKTTILPLLFFLLAASISTAYPVGDWHIYDPANTNFLINNWINNTLAGIAPVSVNATHYSIDYDGVAEKSVGISLSTPLNISADNTTVLGCMQCNEDGTQQVRIWIGNVTPAFGLESMTNATYPGRGVYMRQLNDNEYRIYESHNGTETNRVSVGAPGPDATAYRNLSLFINWTGQELKMIRDNSDIGTWNDAASQALIKELYESRNTLDGGFYVVKSEGGAVSKFHINQIYTTLAPGAPPPNNPPSIDATDPAQGDINVTNGTTQLFIVNASDLDLDPLTYQWYNNSIALSGETTANYTYTANTPINLTLDLEVSDGTDTTNATWNIGVPGVPNLPPNITSTSPTTPHSMLTGQQQEFTATANDPEGGALTYVWYFNQVLTPVTTNTYTYTPIIPDTEHNLTIIVSDGLLTTNHEWNITVNASRYDAQYLPGDISKVSIDIIVGLLAQFVALSVILGLILIWLLRQRKKI